MAPVRVIVVGAGQVGRSIAEDLADNHDVAVVERDEVLVEELTYQVDVLAVEGDGTDLEVLREAGVEDADLLIASTDADETNVVVCGVARTVGDAATIARVKRRNLLTTWQGTEGAFGVDFMVSSDLLAAEAIFRIAGVPGARDVDTFAGGLVRMAEFELDADSPVAGQRISEADRWPSLTFAAVFRDDDVLFPDGDTRLHVDDRVVIIGGPEAVTECGGDITGGDEDRKRRGPSEVVIVGGTGIGAQAADLFEEGGHRTRLIERDPKRARKLAERLPKTTVLQHDASDREFLAGEHVGDADVVVATTNADERNLLISLLADRLGADRTVAVVERAEYAELFEAVGVDVAVDPREETAEEIVRFTRASGTEKVAMLEHDRAEVIEIELDAGSPLAGRQLASAVDDLPGNLVVGAVTRDGELITPRGNTELRAGDHLILFVETAELDAVVDAL